MRYTKPPPLVLKMMNYSHPIGWGIGHFPLSLCFPWAPHPREQSLTVQGLVHWNWWCACWWRVRKFDHHWFSPCSTTWSRNCAMPRRFLAGGSCWETRVNRNGRYPAGIFGNVCRCVYMGFIDGRIINDPVAKEQWTDLRCNFPKVDTWQFLRVDISRERPCWVMVMTLYHLLVGGFEHFFPYIGNKHPNRLIFFRGVQTTNQITIIHPKSSRCPSWSINNLYNPAS